LGIPNSYTKHYDFPHLDRSADDPNVYYGKLDKQGRLALGSVIAGSIVIIRWIGSREGMHAHLEIFVDNPVKARAERKKK
jgi:hypothetical protein